MTNSIEGRTIGNDSKPAGSIVLVSSHPGEEVLVHGAFGADCMAFDDCRLSSPPGKHLTVFATQHVQSSPLGNKCFDHGLRPSLEPAHPPVIAVDTNSIQSERVKLYLFSMRRNASILFLAKNAETQISRFEEIEQPSRKDVFL